MQMYWWQRYGAFPPADESGLYPDKCVVIEHYLRRKEWTNKRLGEALGYTRRYVGYMLNRRMGMDSMTVLRRLVALLDIPPVLLGLDSEYLNVQGERPWWVEAGYPPFPPGDDGYPDASKVIVYKRRQQRKVMRNGKIRPWSQVDLGIALDGTPTIMIRKYEKGRAIDSQERRRALMHILGIPAVLLGLDGLQHLSPTELVGPSHKLPRDFKPNSTLLARYEEVQSTIWKQYYTQHGQNLIPEVKQWIAHLDEITCLTETTKDYTHAVTLQTKYHSFLINVGMELCDPTMALSSANRAIALTEDIQDGAWQTVIIRTRALAYNAQNDFIHALEDINDALDLAKTAHPSIQGHLKVDAAMIYSRAAQSDMMRLQAQKLLEQGWNILQKNDLSEDPYNIRFGFDIYHVRSIETFLALHSSRLTTLGKAIDAIELANQNTKAEMRRRRLLIEIFDAQALFVQKYYEVATEKALVALALSEEIKSYRGKQMIAELCQKLATTSYGGSPQVARLKWKLQQWGKA